jgi:hypothetical protein
MIKYFQPIISNKFLFILTLVLFLSCNSTEKENTKQETTFFIEESAPKPKKKTIAASQKNHFLHIMKQYFQ